MKYQMKLVYIAGPYRAKTIYGVAQNIHNAAEVAIKYWKQGCAVICPHKNTGFLDGCTGELDDHIWLMGDLEMIRRCDAIVMMKNWKESAGARAELGLALSLKKEVIYD